MMVLTGMKSLPELSSVHGMGWASGLFGEVCVIFKHLAAPVPVNGQGAKVVAPSRLRRNRHWDEAAINGAEPKRTSVG